MDSSTQSLPRPKKKEGSPGRRARRILRRFLPLIGVFLLGIMIGISGVVAFIVFLADDGQVSPPTKPIGETALELKVSAEYLARLLEANTYASGLPGTVKNVQVELVSDGPITVSGDDELNAFGLTMTKHFVLELQPVVDSCKLQIKVIRANLEGIPVTGFVRSYEEQLNENLQLRPTGLPRGFDYCMTSVRTDPDGAYVTYSATPQ